MDREKLVSLVVLAYERPEFLKKTMESLLNTPSGHPMEIILHNDGSKSEEVNTFCTQLAKERKISFLINNCGENQGIEKAVKRSIECSSGEYIFKLDTDLEFTPNWLKRAINVFENEDIGAVGLVDYRRYDPADVRFHNVEIVDDYLLVDDFVSSAYGFTRKTYNLYKDHMKHDGWHLYLQSIGFKLAIKDVVNNFGFGRSIYVGEDGKAVKMDHEPLIFDGNI